MSIYAITFLGDLYGADENPPMADRPQNSRIGRSEADLPYKKIQDLTQHHLGQTRASAAHRTRHFLVVWLAPPILIAVMARRIKKSRSLLAPLTEDFVKKLSGRDSRLRKQVFRYGSWTLGFVFAWSLMVGPYRVPRIISLEMERQSLIDANRHLTAELVDVALMKDKLKFDRQYIEQIARTRYFMVYPKETIYRYRGE